MNKQNIPLSAMVFFVNALMFLTASSLIVCSIFLPAKSEGFFEVIPWFMRVVAVLMVIYIATYFSEKDRMPFSSGSWALLALGILTLVVMSFIPNAFALRIGSLAGSIMWFVHIFIYLDLLSDDETYEEEKLEREE